MSKPNYSEQEERQNERWDAGWKIFRELLKFVAGSVVGFIIIRWFFY